VLDFFCPAKKLAVEIDGGQHDMPERREHDQKRTVFLEERGIETLRFWNSQIRENLSAVLERIRMELQTEQPPHPRPLPQGERELGAD
jgi:very-short-patch-repair endonuclease